MIRRRGCRQYRRPDTGQTFGRSCPFFRQTARSQPVKKGRISPLKLSPTPCRCWLSFDSTGRIDLAPKFWAMTSRDHAGNFPRMTDRRNRDLLMVSCLPPSPMESTTAKPTGFCFLTASHFERHSARNHAPRNGTKTPKDQLAKAARSERFILAQRHAMHSPAPRTSVVSAVGKQIRAFSVGCFACPATTGAPRFFKTKTAKAHPRASGHPAFGLVAPSSSPGQERKSAGLYDTGFSDAQSPGSSTSRKVLFGSSF